MADKHLTKGPWEPKSNEVRQRSTTSATGQGNPFGKAAGGIQPPKNATKVGPSGDSQTNTVPPRRTPMEKPVRPTERANTSNPLR